MNTRTTQNFEQVLKVYDHVAQDWHRFFPDRKTHIEHQGQILDSVIKSRISRSEQPLKVLDVTCGDGIQALALASQGYHVVGRDLSSAFIKIAEDNLSKYQPNITSHCTFEVKNMLEFNPQDSSRFDIALSAGNSLPFLLTDEEILGCLNNLYQSLKCGGLLLINLRDYETDIAKPNPVRFNIIHDEKNSSKTILFQTWELHPNSKTYTAYSYSIYDRFDGSAPQIESTQLTLRLLIKNDLEELVAQAGFIDIQWHPEPLHEEWKLTLTAIKR